MNITQVKIHELNKDKLKAFATITIDNEFVITGLKVMDGVNGYFVAYPSRKNTKQNDNNDPNYKLYIDTVYPITKEARKYIEEEVLREYHRYMESNEPTHGVDYPQKNKEQQEYDRKHNTPSIDVSEDDLPF